MFRITLACSAAVTVSCIATSIGAQTIHALDDFPPPQPHVAEAPPPPAPRFYEPPAASFGSAAQLVLTAGAGGSNGASISSTSYAAGAKLQSESIAVGLDLFVLDHLSLGFVVSAGGYDNEGFYGGGNQLSKSTGYSLAAGVRIGADLPLGDLFSLYPSLTVGLESVTNTLQVNDSGAALSVTQTGGWSYAFLPLLVHPAPHLFVGLGPFFRHHFGDASGEAALAGGTSTVGASFVLGGAWGGQPVPAADPTADLGARSPHLGDEGQFVLSAASGVSLGATSYPLANTSSFAVNVSPGFDYFVADGLSMGVGLTIGHSHARYANVVAGPSVSDSTRTAIDGRLGALVHLGPAFSLYTRGYLGVGVDSTSQPFASTSTYVWITGDAPLLVEVSTHLFIGAGPYVTHELTRQVTYAATGNQIGNAATEYGLTTMVGGWL